MTGTLPKPVKTFPFQQKQRKTFPIAIIVSTVVHFSFLFFLINQEIIFSTPEKQDVFVKVKIVELPYGTGGALYGNPGGKYESRSVEPNTQKEKPKLTLPGKEEKKVEGKSPIKNGDEKGVAVGLGGEGVVGLGGKQKGLLLDAADFPYEWYKARLEQTLKANWKKPLMNKKLATSVHFTILDSGKINDLKIVKSSGNSEFDKSVLNAIYDSVPFPKFPPQYTSDKLGVLYTFELEKED
jgi:TonB family protein